MFIRRKEVHASLEQHEGKSIMTSFFGVRYDLPFLIVGLTAHRLSQTETCGQFSLEMWFDL